MNFRDEIDALSKELADLASCPDDALLTRYKMDRPERPQGIYWQLRWLAGSALRWLESVGLLPTNPWPVSLLHAGRRRNAAPVIIWAVGADRDTLRRSARGFSDLFDQLPGLAPVLVTDVADFAYFSRLGWLVEYVPRVGGEGEPFDSRKARFLARLYEGAPALPVSAGLEAASGIAELRRWLTDRTGRR